MKKLDKIKSEMYSNGYSYFHNGNFLNYPTLPCYIPENAESIADVFSRNDLTELVKEWLQKDETKEYLLEAYDNVMPIIDETFINNFVLTMFDNLEWTFPSTYLAELLN